MNQVNRIIEKVKEMLCGIRLTEAEAGYLMDEVKSRVYKEEKPKLDENAVAAIKACKKIVEGGYIQHGGKVYDFGSDLIKLLKQGAGD